MCTCGQCTPAHFTRVPRRRLSHRSVLGAATSTPSVSAGNAMSCRVELPPRSSDSLVAPYSALPVLSARSQVRESSQDLLSAGTHGSATFLLSSRYCHHSLNICPSFPLCLPLTVITSHFSSQGTTYGGNPLGCTIGTQTKTPSCSPMPTQA